ncbi:MAG: hypothetical protein QMD85_00620 [Candidatus Aenigmarchaeota archaeon]|nr:hypothetical protein [Candidatus Aenigmarchaeota archaeon]MDI6722030.1 hypothetical protein [Candidatus Aenigmarchaeota archaeon]
MKIQTDKNLRCGNENKGMLNPRSIAPFLLAIGLVGYIALIGVNNQLGIVSLIIFAIGIILLFR